MMKSSIKQAFCFLIGLMTVSGFNYYFSVEESEKQCIDTFSPTSTMEDEYNQQVYVRRLLNNLEKEIKKACDIVSKIIDLNKKEKAEQEIIRIKLVYQDKNNMENPSVWVGFEKESTQKISKLEEEYKANILNQEQLIKELQIKENYWESERQILLKNIAKDDYKRFVNLIKDFQSLLQKKQQQYKTMDE